MRIRVIETGAFKLDGGAMFGIVPKTIWSKLNPPDAANLCTWSMRCLLVETENRKILIDTGIGNKQDDKFRRHFLPSGQDNLWVNLESEGIKPGDITDVLFTHLHFDHAGGALIRLEDGTYAPAFPNAVYWTSEAHLRWATRPNAREAASFLPENFMPLQALGRMEFLPVQEEDQEWLPGISLRFVYGHTEAMIIPILQFEGRTFVYCADLIASTHHVGLPYVMAYDIRPLLTLQEKERVLRDAAKEGHILIFEHDPKVEAAEIGMSANGKFVVDRTVRVSE